jgi:hypothetical protein
MILLKNQEGIATAKISEIRLKLDQIVQNMINYISRNNDRRSMLILRTLKYPADFEMKTDNSSNPDQDNIHYLGDELSSTIVNKDPSE